QAVQNQQPSAPTDLNSTPSPSPVPAASTPTVADEAEIQLRDARQSNDPELVAGALMHLAEERMRQSQPRAALPPLEEALAIGNTTGNDRLGREASMA